MTRKRKGGSRAWISVLDERICPADLPSEPNDRPGPKEILKMNASLTPHRESSGRAGRQLSLTDRLSEFVREARWEDIPAAVRHEAKRSLGNYFAVALAGG